MDSIKDPSKNEPPNAEKKWSLFFHHFLFGIVLVLQILGYRVFVERHIIPGREILLQLLKKILTSGLVERFRVIKNERQSISYSTSDQTHNLLSFILQFVLCALHFFHYGLRHGPIAHFILHFIVARFLFTQSKVSMLIADIVNG